MTKRKGVSGPPLNPPSYYDAEPRCPKCNRLIELATDHVDDCPLRGLDVEELADVLPRLDPEDEDVVIRRKALAYQCEQLEPGTEITLTYDSSQGRSTRKIDAVVRESPDDRAVLFASCYDLKGDVFVRPIEIEHELYGELRVISTGSKHTNRQTTCGDLVAVAETGGE